MRIDKVKNTFRAPLAADWAGSETAVAVGLDVNGRVVAGVGNSRLRGLLCKPSPASAGQNVDVLCEAELVDCVGLTAGTNYTALTTTGVIGNSAADGTHINIGYTVEATRLIVRVPA